MMVVIACMSNNWQDLQARAIVKPLARAKLGLASTTKAVAEVKAAAAAVALKLTWIWSLGCPERAHDCTHALQSY